MINDGVGAKGGSGMQEPGIPAETVTPRDAALKNPLALAYLGDTVWDLLTRERLLATAARVNTLHRQAVAFVNAGAQAQALARLEPLLTDDEQDVVRRGVNAHSRHTARVRATLLGHPDLVAAELACGSGMILCTRRRDRG